MKTKKTKKAKIVITLPKSSSHRINEMFSRTTTSIDELRQHRDLALRDGDMHLAFKCAIGIDRLKGYYK